MIYRNTSEYQKETDSQPKLGEEDLEQIVLTSGLRSRARSPKIPTPSEVTAYSGKSYKVRAYPGEEAALEYQQLMADAEHLFTRCYGRIDRFLVLEYINSDRLGSARQVLDDIPEFLAELAAIPARRTPEDDFRFLCANIEASGIFQPRTIELIREYYSQAGALGVKWGLEYYDAMPRNFAYADEGRLVSIDEKHLRIGPRGVSLVKPSEQLSSEDFLKFKQAYLARVGAVPFDDPKYQRFLRFYRHMTALGALAALRLREANMYEYSFHLNRQQILQITGAPRSLRLSEETQWVRYWVHQVGRFFVKAWWFSQRRLMRVMARNA